MRVTLMHNPKAGEGEASKERLLEALRAAGYDAEYQSTKKKNFAKALEDPGDLVVVAGGDGTVAKIATRLAGRGVPIAIVPAGTANNIATSLGVCGELEQVIAGWEGARRRKFDVGLVSAPWGETRFLEAVGFGVFTQAMAVLDSREDTGGAPDDVQEELVRDTRFLSLTLSSCRARPISLTLDGDELSDEYLMLEILNIPCIGPNLCLAPQADPGDGRLDLALVRERDRERLAAYLEARLKGAQAPPDFEIRSGRRVHVRWDGAPLHVDDGIYTHELGDAAPAGNDGVIDVWLEEAVEILVGR